MSLAAITSRIRYGTGALRIRVEAHLLAGLPAFHIVGLPEKAVNESRERVRSAIISGGFVFPNRRITINLSPADLPKEGGGQLDLAIAMSILAASEQISTDRIPEYEFLGELALSGEVLPIRGFIPIAWAAAKAKRRLIIGHGNSEEAGLIKDIIAYSAKHIIQVVAHLEGKARLKKIYHSPKQKKQSTSFIKMEDIKGQESAKRALLVAAAGGHHLLMFGPPGSGKTLLASSLIGLLPPLTDEEALEITSIASLGRDKEMSWGERPFRSPHHTASSVAIVGGGSPPIPGEISLAHKGVLFLDELPEFSRQVLETLRQPLESGKIIIARAAHRIAFPASFQLIAAMNPCPCGHNGDSNRECRCTPDQIKRYLTKLSGPLLDRIDMTINVPAVPYNQTDKNGTSSLAMRNQVVQAYQIQLKRSGKINSRLSIKETENLCIPSQQGEKMLRIAVDRLKISMRSYHRLLRVARTIADIEQTEEIQAQQLSEALSYRHIF